MRKGEIGTAPSPDAPVKADGTPATAPVVASDCAVVGASLRHEQMSCRQAGQCRHERNDGSDSLFGLEACSLPNAQQTLRFLAALGAPTMVNVPATHHFRHNAVLSRALPEKKPK
jgi:hypothetical protein